MSNYSFNTSLSLVFVLFRYNPCPCTGQGVSRRDGEKRPHITFWKDPFTPQSFPVEACPHQDRLFYNHFLSSHLLRFPCWLFIGAFCPSCLHCSLHSTTPISLITNFLWPVGCMQNADLYLFWNKSVGNFNAFLSRAVGKKQKDGWECLMYYLFNNDQETLVF